MFLPKRPKSRKVFIFLAKMKLPWLQYLWYKSWCGTFNSLGNMGNQRKDVWKSSKKTKVTMGAFSFDSKLYKLKLKCLHNSWKILTRKSFSCKFLGETFHFLQESCKHLAMFNLVCKTVARNFCVCKKLARNVDFARILQKFLQICFSCWPG